MAEFDDQIPVIDPEQLGQIPVVDPEVKPKKKAVRPPKAKKLDPLAPGYKPPPAIKVTEEMREGTRKAIADEYARRLIQTQSEQAGKLRELPYIQSDQPQEFFDPEVITPNMTQSQQDVMMKRWDLEHTNALIGQEVKRRQNEAIRRAAQGKRLDPVQEEFIQQPVEMDQAPLPYAGPEIPTNRWRSNLNAFLEPVAQLGPMSVEGIVEFMDLLGNIGQSEEEAQKSALGPTVNKYTRGASSFIRGSLPYNPEYPETPLVSGLGSAAGFIGANYVGAQLRIPSLVTTAIVGAGMNIAEVTREADRMHIDPKRRDAAILLAAGTGLTEIAGLGKTLDRFGLKRQFIHRMFEIAEEGGQEGLQQWLNNINAAFVGAYDPTRPMSKDVLQSIILGSAVGGVAQVGSKLYSGYADWQQSKPIREYYKRLRKANISDPNQIAVRTFDPVNGRIKWRGLAQTVTPEQRRINLEKLLEGSQVTADLYHGTPQEIDIEQIDFSKQNPRSLYGPGFYMTQDPDIAAREGTSYAIQEAPPKAASEILKDTKFTERLDAEVARQMRDAATNPEDPNYNLLEYYGHEKLGKMIRQNAHAKLLHDMIQESREGSPHAYKLKARITNAFWIDQDVDPVERERLSEMAVQMGAKDSIRQTTPQRIYTNHQFYRELESAFGNDRAKVNELLQKAGYDGITHIGGQGKSVEFPTREEADARAKVTGGWPKTKTRTQYDLLDEDSHEYQDMQSLAYQWVHLKEGAKPTKRQVFTVARNIKLGLLDGNLQQFSPEIQDQIRYSADKLFAQRATRDIHEVEGHRVWIAFPNAVVKSATGNNGRYDVADPRLSRTEEIGEPDADSDPLAFDVMPGLGEEGAPYALVPPWVMAALAGPTTGGVNFFQQDLENILETVEELAPSDEHAVVAVKAIQEVAKQSKERGLSTVNLIGRRATPWLVKEMVDMGYTEAEAKDALIRGRIHHEVLHSAMEEGLLPKTDWIEAHPVLNDILDREGNWAGFFPGKNRTQALRMLAFELPAYFAEGISPKYASLNVTPDEILDVTMDILTHLRDTYGKDAYNDLRQIARMRPNMAELVDIAESMYEEQMGNRPTYTGTPVRTQAARVGQLATKDLPPQQIKAGDKVRIPFLRGGEQHKAWDVIDRKGNTITIRNQDGTMQMEVPADTVEFWAPQKVDLGSYVQSIKYPQAGPFKVVREFEDENGDAMLQVQDFRGEVREVYAEDYQSYDPEATAPPESSEYKFGDTVEIQQPNGNWDPYVIMQVVQDDDGRVELKVINQTSGKLTRGLFPDVLQIRKVDTGEVVKKVEDQTQKQQFSKGDTVTWKGQPHVVTETGGTTGDGVPLVLLSPPDNLKFGTWVPESRVKEYQKPTLPKDHVEPEVTDEQRVQAKVNNTPIIPPTSAVEIAPPEKTGEMVRAGILQVVDDFSDVVDQRSSETQLISSSALGEDFGDVIQGLHDNITPNGKVEEDWREAILQSVKDTGKLPTLERNTLLGQIYEAALRRNYPASVSTAEVAIMLSQGGRAEAHKYFNQFFPEGGAPPLSIATRIEKAVALAPTGDALTDSFINILKTFVAMNGTIPKQYSHLPIAQAFENAVTSGLHRDATIFSLVAMEYNRSATVQYNQKLIEEQAKKAEEAAASGTPVYMPGDVVQLRDAEGDIVDDDWTVIEIIPTNTGRQVKVQRHDDGRTRTVKYSDLGPPTRQPAIPPPSQPPTPPVGGGSGGPGQPQVPGGPNYPEIMVPRMHNTYQRAVDQAFLTMLQAGQVTLDPKRRVFLQVIDALEQGQITSQQFSDALAQHNMSLQQFVDEYGITVHEAAMTLNELSRIVLKYKNILKKNPKLARMFMNLNPPGQQGGGGLGSGPQGPPSGGPTAGPSTPGTSSPGGAAAPAGQQTTTTPMGVTGAVPPGVNQQMLQMAANFLTTQNQIDILFSEIEDTILGKNMWERAGSLIRQHMLSYIGTAVVNAWVSVGRIPLHKITHGGGALFHTMYEGKKEGKSFDQYAAEGWQNMLKAMAITNEVLAAIKPNELRHALPSKDNRTQGKHHDYDLMMDQMLKAFPDLKARLLAPGVGPEMPAPAYQQQITDIENLIGRIGDLPTRARNLKRLEVYEKRYKSNQKNFLKKWIVSKDEWLMDKLCKPMRWQELIFRQPMFFGYLNYKLERQGMNLQQMLASPDALAKIPRDVLDEAVDEALDYTYSYMPHLDGGRIERGAYRLIGFLNDLGPVSAVAGAAFPRAMYNGVKFTLEYSPLGTVPTIVKLFKPKEMQDRILNISYPINQMTEHDFQKFTKGIIGTVLYGIAASMIWMGLIGDEWWQLKVPFGSKFTKSGNPLYVDMRKYQPLSTFVRLADLSLRLGGSITKSDFFGRRAGELDVGKELKETLLGLRNYPGMEDLVTGFFDMWNDQGEGLYEKSKTSVGMGMSWVTRPLMNIRDLVAVFSDTEQKQSDLKGTGIIGPMLDNVPWIRRYVFEQKQEPTRSNVEIGVAPISTFTMGARLVEAENFAGREWRRLGILNKTFLPPDPNASMNRAMNKAFFEEVDELSKEMENSYDYQTATDAEKAAFWESEIGGDNGIRARARQAAQEGDELEQFKREQIRKSRMGKYEREASGFTKELNKEIEEEKKNK